MKLKIWLLALSFLWLVSGAWAITITVDGDLSDWGLNTSSFGENSNDWDPNIPGVFVFQEDWVGNNGYLEPGYGGQKYDVEAILATFDAENLYIAIATGFPQVGTEWDAGDISLDIGNDGTWDYAVVVSNYVDGSENRGLNLGGVYEVDSWRDVYYSSHGVSNPFRMENGSYIGGGSLAYSDDPDHSFSRFFIEVAIPLDLIDWSSDHIAKIHWTMECGNDYGEVVAHTPEPATYMLLGVGLFLTAIFIRKQRKA
ncbi:protein of unknown function DUF1555 [Thermodesulfatator indicus DSM 15286]|uniref:Ice-binding protein C-terminal domain-containing protein n=1 Tax=Thermodesulfatator indicus (strain DSM 15286 / JCM 11887 / CIR29812) TaxID=667014 RepID=F8ACT3_THEID|nr:PEP-CTERM sorting domain-containing protein [Thermodesulfatator indicus]AEH44724.1 protein of unknown function DUF1555 [Thermodesulfatator indicus DSM 15286]